MTVSQIITLSQRLLGDNSSRAFLRTILDGVVKDLYDGVSGKHRIKFDSDTGRHPYIVTTAGTYQYDYPSWAETILRVYDATLADEGSDIYPGYAATADNTTRTITFADDPGTETTKYRLLGTYNPTDITSETDSLCVVPTNSRYPLLVVGIISQIQPEKRGYTEERYQRLKDEFRAKLRSGSSPATSTTRMKGVFQEGDGYTPADYRYRNG